MAATAEPTAATDDANDDDGENSPIGRTLGKHSDGISLLLARLPLAEQVRAGEVCRMFNDGSSATLNARSSLDLSTLHSALDDEGLENILGKCPSLRTLNVSGCKKLTDIGVLATCAALEHVSLPGCDALSDVRPLGQCKELRTLDLVGCKAIDDISALRECARLWKLDIRGTGYMRVVSQGGHVPIIPSVTELRGPGWQDLGVRGHVV